MGIGRGQRVVEAQECKPVSRLTGRTTHPTYPLTHPLFSKTHDMVPAQPLVSVQCLADDVAGGDLEIERVEDAQPKNLRRRRMGREVEGKEEMQGQQDILLSDG